jgi:hypothetical protein
MADTTSVFYRIGEAIKGAFIGYNSSDTVPVKDIRSLTQAQYNALTSPDANTLYIINDTARDTFVQVTLDYSSTSSGTYTQTGDFTHYNYDSTGGAIIVNLLPVTTHHEVTTHKLSAGSNSVTLTAPSGTTIDGSQTKVLSSIYDSVSIYSDGTNYFIQ